MTELWSSLTGWLQGHLGLSPGVMERLAGSLAIIAIYFLARVVAARLFEHRIQDVAKKYILLKSISYVLGFALVIGMMVVWFGNVTGWVSYLGILSAGLAIALQDPITNFAGWIFMSIRKPFVVGDRIQVGEHRGDVIDIRLFQFTMVEIGNWVDSDQSTGRIIHVPNGWVFKKSTANYTQGFSFIWNELPITVTFESDWEKAKGILTEVANRHSLLKSHDAEQQVKRAARKYFIQFRYLTPIVWTSVADVGVTLTLRYICDPRKRRSSAGAIWEDVLRVFAQHDDIDFAYPTTRFYDNMSEGKPGARAPGPGATSE